MITKIIKNRVGLELSYLVFVQGQSYSLRSGNGMSNPVFEITKKINQMEQRIKAIRRLRGDLVGSDIHKNSANVINITFEIFYRTMK